MGKHRKSHPAPKPRKKGASRKAPASPAEARTASRAPKRRPKAPSKKQPKPSRRRKAVALDQRPTLSPPPRQPDFGSVAPEEATELGIGSRVIAPNIRFEPLPGSAPPAAAPPTGDVETQIRALEARLDGLIRSAAASSEPDAQTAEPEPEPAPDQEATEEAETPPEVDPIAQDYVARQWGREALRSRFEVVDDFGLDPALDRKLGPLLKLLYRRYFRVRAEGIEQIPESGRAVVVANHSGTLPLDGAMLRMAMRLDHPSHRDLRWLAEDFFVNLPFAGVLLNRIGAVRACRENAEGLLDKESLIAVFPEGMQGIRKLYGERYQLQRFGRGGYIRLCLRMRAPLIPCAIIGAEETNPLLYRMETLAELVNLPYLPITPTFPWLGPLGLLPAPTRWTMRFGEAIHLDHYGAESADDHVLVGRLSERVRGEIQALLDSGLRSRKSVWFG